MLGVLQGMKDEVSRQAYGMTAKEAQAKGICVSCKQPIKDLIKTKVAQAEYNISGLCNACFHRAAEE